MLSWSGKLLRRWNASVVIVISKTSDDDGSCPFWRLGSAPFANVLLAYSSKSDALQQMLSIGFSPVITAPPLAATRNAGIVSCFAYCISWNCWGNCIVCNWQRCHIWIMCLIAIQLESYQCNSNHRLQDLCCLRLHSWCPAAVRKSIRMVGLVEAKSNFTKDETVGGRPMTVDLIGRWTMNIASKSWVTEPIITC